MPFLRDDYKICSTFDSSPEIGSIGAAVAALRDTVASGFVPIVGGQPSLRRYCLFGHLFAAGSGGAVHRIDRHPTMSCHPVTPMREADLRRHLDAQGMPSIASIDYTGYTAPIEDAEGPVLFDVAMAEHLAAIGRLIWRRARSSRLLAVGASSVAQALIEAWRKEGSLAAAGRPALVGPATGPVFVLSGSQSPVTAAQIAAASSYEKIIVRGDGEEAMRRSIALLHAGRHVLAHTPPEGAMPADVALAPTCARLFARVLRAVPLSRAGVAGGDTSSYAMQALGVEYLEYAAALAPGVPLCRARGADLAGLEIMLKGGQMGPPDVFERLLFPQGD